MSAATNNVAINAKISRNDLYMNRVGKNYE